MKKIIIIVFIISIFCLVGCTDLSHYVPIDEYYNKLSELEEANSKIDSNAIEILELKEEVNTLENNLTLSKEELIKYRSLVDNLNELLSNVYYVYQKKSDGSSIWGTGFSIEYQGNYYLVTVGHAIENEYGIFKNLGFKDIGNRWIYPKLLAYENDFRGHRDYAILFSDKVTSGLNYALNNSFPQYMLGNLNVNILRRYTRAGVDGECGSPIVDLSGEVVGIYTGDFVDIDIILEAIDNLK